MTFVDVITHPKMLHLRGPTPQPSCEVFWNKTKEIFQAGKNVVIDYIIFGDYERFIEIFRQTFGNNFDIVVLFPSQEEIMKRDKDRECWTTGPDRIAAVYREFEEVKDVIGAEHFLNTSSHIPKETAAKVISLMD